MKWYTCVVIYAIIDDVVYACIENEKWVIMRFMTTVSETEMVK